jgi:hypothetical protein
MALLSERVAYFRQSASDKVRELFNSATDFENVGETVRQCLDSELSCRPLPSSAFRSAIPTSAVSARISARTGCAPGYGARSPATLSGPRDRTSAQPRRGTA